MTVEDDRVCRSLRSARENLCTGQTNLVETEHRAAIQTAIDMIDRVGVMVCADWSRYAEPEIEES